LFGIQLHRVQHKHKNANDIIHNDVILISSGIAAHVIGVETVIEYS